MLEMFNPMQDRLSHSQQVFQKLAVQKGEGKELTQPGFWKMFFGGEIDVNLSPLILQLECPFWGTAAKWHLYRNDFKPLGFWQCNPPAPGKDEQKGRAVLGEDLESFIHMSCIVLLHIATPTNQKCVCHFSGGNCGKHSLNSCWRMIQMMEMDGADMYPWSESYCPVILNSFIAILNGGTAEHQVFTPFVLQSISLGKDSANKLGNQQTSLAWEINSDRLIIG